MMVVSLGTIVLYTLAVSALAVSFGVFYPQFGTENAAQIPTSYGGVVYMMASLTLLAVIIMIEAVPVASVLRSWQVGAHTPAAGELALAGLAVVVVCVSATIIPLRLSSRRLEQMEW
jgi:ABC-2 type transport system permease protein